MGQVSREQDMDQPRPNYQADSYTNLGTGYLITFTRGNKFFELANHLGSVNATLADRHLPVNSGGNVWYYQSVMGTAADYTPFGMQMPGRIYTGTGESYKYKFNGKERIYEINGKYHQYDYGMRIYDDRLGRFLSVDPLTKSFPWYSPYQYAGNSPITNIDLDGKEDLWFMVPVIKWMATSKLQNEVASVGRLASGQSGEASVPQQIQGHARSTIVANQKVNDLTNTVDYFTRPYKITNEAASVVFPEAAVLNGMYQIYEGDYVSGTVNIVGGAGGTWLKALTFSERAYVNGVLKTVSNNGDEAARLFNEGVRDFAELENVTIKSSAVFKSANASEFRALESLRGKADSRDVGKIMKLMKEGVDIDPIEVYVNNGNKYILNGHHRVEAASRLNMPVKYKELTLQQAMDTYGYKNEVEILNKYSESFMGSRLDNRLINKVANGE
ncbi:hypothetical protein DC498_08155 [Terrimonas sp.]|nr:hypothetical protein DC498_08155 [Terrimonas sp.]